MPVLSISVCTGIRAGVYPLHTHTPFSISYLRTLCTGSGFACSRSQLSGKLSLLSSPSPFSVPSRMSFPSMFKPRNFFFVVVVLWLSPPQLYGEYREQLGNFARREAARLLTERQWKRQAGDAGATARKGHGRRHHHPVTLDLHHSQGSSSKKSRPYSKCQGDSSIKTPA